jgi:hypothetical protein
MATYSQYKSGSDSDIDSGTDSGTDYESDKEDPRYALLRAVNTTRFVEDDPKYMKWDNSNINQTLENMEYSVAPRTTKTSLFSMKSVNRDKSIYPTPYHFQIKLPRVYKNVTKFQLVQLSFPNSSGGVTGQALFVSSLMQDMINNGVPSSCVTTCISIANCSSGSNTVGMMELNRTNASGDPLLTTVSVPEGIYSDPQLADELTFQSNSTPPLNIISYQQFKDTFMNTRDVSVLFNEPGDTFYSKTGARINRPTKEAIMNTYYTQQHIDGLVITERIAFTAYYYPILKELLALPLSRAFLTNYDELYSRVNEIFEGLDSDFYYDTCFTNQIVLDNFRPHLTFELHNVNNYTWRFNDKDSRFTTIHNQLHTSIQRDITKNYQMVLNRELAFASLTPGAFTTLKTNSIGYSAIYKHLETNLSSVLGNYALVSDYQYQGGPDHITKESTFTFSSLVTDEQFNGMFQYKSTIGGLYSNYGGLVMNFRNFTDYQSTLSAYYTIVQSTNAILSGINQAITMNHHMYVSTKYTSILPQKMLDTKSYVSNQGIPVSFMSGNNAYVPGIVPLSMQAPSNTVVYPDSNPLVDLSVLSPATFASYEPTDCSTICCNYITSMLSKWYACLPVNSVIGTLDYRLGLVSIVPNQYNVVSTLFKYTSTGNLNFLMQINDEQGFNNMDIAMNENRTITSDTTGQIKLVAAKILMGNVGDSGISQTLIQNPSIFENTLGKLDKLNFKIYYDDQNITPAWQLLPFQYEVNEWNATFQIDEEVGFINQDPKWDTTPSIDIPKDPRAFPYIYLTEKPKN